MTNPKMRSVGKARLPTTDFRYDNDLCLVTPTSKPQLDAEFSKLLVGWRKLLGMSQEELAVESGYGLRTIGRWERGESAPRKIDRMKMEATLDRLQKESLSKSLSPKRVSSDKSLPEKESVPPKKLTHSASDESTTTKEARTLSRKENKKVSNNVSKTVDTKASKKSKEKKYDCSTCPLRDHKNASYVSGEGEFEFPELEEDIDPSKIGGES